MESFIKISLSVWAVEMTQTHAHTHIHTHSQTDTLGSIATCSVKLTEYKQDRSRRCQNIQSIDTFLRKIQIESTKYYQMRYLRLRFSGNIHHTSPTEVKHFVFGGHFVIFSKTRLAITSKVINRFCLFLIATTGPSFT